MRKDQLIRLLGNIESLSASTKLIISTPDGVEIELDGRCSPFVSHQTVNYSESNLQIPEHVYIFKNERCAIAVDFKNQSVHPSHAPVIDAIHSAAREQSDVVCRVHDHIIPTNAVHLLLESFSDILHINPYDLPNKLCLVINYEAQVMAWDGQEPVFKIWDRTVPDSVIEAAINGAKITHYHDTLFVYYPEDTPSAPPLDIVEDGEWHQVNEPAMVGCEVGTGWYAYNWTEKELQKFLDA